MLGVRKETHFVNVQFSTTKRGVLGKSGWEEGRMDLGHGGGASGLEALRIEEAVLRVTK